MPFELKSATSRDSFRFGSDLRDENAWFEREKEMGRTEEMRTRCPRRSEAKPRSERGEMHEKQLVE